MSEPKTDYKDPLSGIRQELGDAISCLFMHPESINPEHEDDKHLVYVDRWVKHSHEHLNALRECLNQAERERKLLRMLATYMIAYLNDKPLEDDIKEKFLQLKEMIMDKEFNIPIEMIELKFLKKYCKNAL